MPMKQVIQSTRTGKLAVKDVPEPKLTAGHILVETRASLISAGTERMVVNFAAKSLAGKAKARPDLVRKVIGKARRDGIVPTVRAVLARLDEPLPLGYSAAGRVRAVGDGLEGRFRVGERVAVAGAGAANHSELNLVPANLAAPIPDGVVDEHACFGTVGAIAMHSVRNLGAGLGDVVAVIGAGLVGQLAAQFLSLSGVRVVALDYNQDRLNLALILGAEAAVNLADGTVEADIAGLTAGRGCDGILIAAATESSEPFHTAAAIARDRARVCMVGMTGTAFPYQAFMKKELNLVVSRSYGPGRYDEDYEGRDVKYPEGWVRWTETENLAECLRLMSPERPHTLDVGRLITHRFPLEDAGLAYEVVKGGEAHMGVVLTYGEGVETKAPLSFPIPAQGPKKGCVLGLIGAGNFARAVLLPELKKLNHVHLHTVVTRRGATADQVRESFGFEVADTDADRILKNPDINAVLIATRHDSHAELTVRALEAGKAVLVEKPLGLNRDQLDRVAAARSQSDGFFQVGFNRRFAPLAIKLRDHLAKISGTKFVLLRINAGSVPADSWVLSPEEGGGRILGEMCHFVDLARYFIGERISSVQADATMNGGKGLDDVTATIRFAGGSLATIAYTGLGDDGAGKERFEAFAGGAVMMLDNFRSLKVSGHGRKRTHSGDGGKGVNGALRAFTDAVAAGGPAPVDEAELLETSTATVAVLESLRTGARVDL